MNPPTMTTEDDATAIEADALANLIQLAHDIAYNLPTKSRLALGPVVLAQARTAAEKADWAFGQIEDEPLPRMLRG